MLIQQNFFSNSCYFYFYRGFCARNCLSGTPKMCSIGLRYSELEGKGMNWNSALRSQNHLTTYCVLWHGALCCQKTPFPIAKRDFMLGCKWFVMMFRQSVDFIVHSITTTGHTDVLQSIIQPPPTAYQLLFIGGLLVEKLTQPTTFIMTILTLHYILSSTTFIMTLKLT